MNRLKEEQPLHFEISSALKSVIGQDLITNDFVAIFELVKNSFDAHAKNVDIIFEDINGKIERIFIIDDGKGMSYQDLVNKWLFVAYSAKKDGSEDNNANRIYAGNKGVGRFLAIESEESSSSNQNQYQIIVYIFWMSIGESLKLMQKQSLKI
ncbi:ATP-binding protein [Vibrio olivae]